MKRKEVIDFISNMEIKYPVNEWKIGEMELWPIFKMDIFFRWYKSQAEISKQKHIRSPGIIRKLLNILKSCLNVTKFILKSSAKVSDIYCGSAAHRIEYQGKFINRYFWPLIDKAKGMKYLEIDYGFRDATKNYANSKRIIFVQDFYGFFNFLSLFEKKNAMNIPGYDSFLRDIQDNIINLPVDYKSVIYSRCKSILIYSRIFKMIFEKLKPINVFGLCYYDNAMFGMHFAANHLGINNIDMQHGGQGPLHPMYNYASVPPKGYYSVVPQKFWCWDQASSYSIQKWASISDYVSVINGGNPWIVYATKAYSENNSYSFPEGKRIILLTLQEPELQDNIVDAIQLSSDEYQWWIRLHPRMKEGIEDIKTQLQSRKIFNFEIERATNYPLPIILKNTFLHISRYSGSIIEAGLLGVKSLIIDPIGIETYSNYVDVGIAINACEKTGSELTRIIKSID